ncbi:hypothetical protein [Variovorax sp. OV084]|uniref:hypothetical protein n=1 Tax=Variovorax sp. OV084 TaxID=1882777 RepID=UPI0008B09020|nr:hypothetical protein [Variovorax sp. OV084]SET02102.1 hypothetical protein SAMN05443580_1011231 [Variovorax sp. OV084]
MIAADAPSTTTKMNTAYLLHTLPHIVLLKAALDHTKTVLDVPGCYTRREPLCPRASDAYNCASAAYFAAMDEAHAELKIIEASIAEAYGLDSPK